MGSNPRVRLLEVTSSRCDFGSRGAVMLMWVGLLVSDRGQLPAQAISSSNGLGRSNILGKTRTTSPLTC